MSTTDENNLLSLTAKLVAARVRSGPVAADALPDLIRTVFSALDTARRGSDAGSPSRPIPAVPVKRSVRPDHLICLEDGRRMKMLKRHLRVNYGMTPAQYRARWGLPPDYPMTAPEASAARSARARAVRMRNQAGVFAVARKAA